MGSQFQSAKEDEVVWSVGFCCVVFAHIGVEAKPNSQSVSEKLSDRECSGLGGECKTNGKTCCGSLWCNGAAASHYCEDDSCSRWGGQCGSNGKTCCQGFTCQSDGICTP